MTEYWLQKKTLGGWSHVTWYSDEVQARTNYETLRQGKGYSYRLCKVEIIGQQLLEEVVEVEAPSLEPEKPTWFNLKPKDHQGNRLEDEYTHSKPTNPWAGQKPNGWSKPAINHEFLPGVEAKPTHGLAGMVWMVNHVTKQKSRITPDLVEQFELNGWERGGPKTKFRE